MDAKTLQIPIDDLLVGKLVSLAKIDVDKNWLTLEWGDLYLGGQQLPEILLALSTVISFRGDITLDLSSNPINDYMVEQIFQLLAQYRFSSSLGICLYENNWGVRGLNSILNYLSAENCPQDDLFLDLGENKLNDQHMALIAEALKKSQLPRKLTLLLSQNNIADQGVSILWQTLVGINNTHISINLHENDISEEMENSINTGLRNRKNIEIEFDGLSVSSDEEQSMVEDMVEDQNEVLYYPPVFASCNSDISAGMIHPSNNVTDTNGPKPF